MDWNAFYQGGGWKDFFGQFTWVDWLLLLIALLLLLWLLFRLLSKKSGKGKSGSGSGQQGSSSGGKGGQQGSSPEDLSKREQRLIDRQRFRVGPLQQALEGDPMIAQKLLQKAGLNGTDPKVVIANPLLLAKAASTIKDRDLQMYHLAATQQLIDFDLEKSTSREPVNYPTSDVEPDQLMDFAQLPEVVPEDLMIEDDEFQRRFVINDLTRLQFYESVTKQFVLAVRRDISPSMDEEMNDGMRRRDWARAVCANLMAKAVRGEAKYLFRDFDGSTHGLSVIDDTDKAQRMLDSLLDGVPVGSATDIRGAIRSGVEDIRSQGGEFTQAELLLVSDGEDDSLEAGEIRKMLGEDIFLHVVIIGGAKESPALRQVAKTYYKFE